MADTNDTRPEGDTLTPAQRQWVDALRSGEYKQTTHVLCRLDEKGEPVGFCCLGVACDLAVKAGVKVEVDTGTYHDCEVGTVPAREFDCNLSWLPPAVEAWLGLRDDTGGYGDDGTGDSHSPHTLAGDNDAGETFERIADIIESRPKGLFS